MSYAYFTGMISGEGKEIRVSAKELRILFTDDNELASSEIIPGWKESKTFSVKNESGNTFNYNIVINDLVNTFVTEGYLDIPAGVTHEYTIEFIYHDNDEDQSEDMGKIFCGTLGIIEGSKIKIDKVVRDQTCTLTTEKINYNLTTNITGGSLKPSNVMVAHGDSKEFTITASTGYTLLKKLRHVVWY